MTAYLLLRILCACLALALALRIHHYRLSGLRTFSAYLAAEAISLAIPARLDDPAYWRWCWSPIAAVRLCLLVGASLELFAFLRPRTLRGERSAILTFAIAGGALCVLAGWYWAPENWFQRFAVLRQYAILLVAVAASLGWWYVRVRRPVPMCEMLRDHGFYWCIWCWVTFAANSATKGGIVWRVLPWDEPNNYWVIIGIGVAGLKLILMGAWLFSLPDLRLPERPARRDRGLCHAWTPPL